MVFSKFDSLSVRPPTPPKDLEDQPQAADEALNQFLEDPFGETPALPKVVAATKNLLNTPEQSPSSDISIPSSSASSRKRVNFELQLCTTPHKKAIARSWTPSRSSPLRPLPQTRVSRPLKSILKPSDETATPPPNDEGATAHKFKTFAEMLESIVKLLASSERPSRMDAYHSLQRTMQAYDKLPDEQALKRKMSLLTQFIRRDVQAQSPTGTGLDSQMVGQSLKLLMALFRITEAAAAMDDDFCAFIVDRSIQVAADSTMPKIIVNTHLATLMQQNFRPKIMNNARVEKLLDVLDTIHERIGGFSVQAYRIRIFRKLIPQRPDVMIKHTERWFKHLLKAFMATQKDINQSALDMALTAAKTIGDDRHVAKSCLAILNRGAPVVKLFTKELEKMLGGDHAALVPQIWAAVTVLLRDSMNSEAFPSLKEWLELFQKCIASSKDAAMVQPGELPVLDPKWVRRSLPAILPLVETLLDATPFSEKEEQEDEPIKTMWSAVLTSLVEASSKEVMASSETKDAMAHIVNLLRRVWDSQTAQLAVTQQNEDTWANKFCFLIESVVQKLGAFHFAEKCLIRNGSDEFEVASTPSHRSRQHGTRISPLLYCIDLLVNQSEGKLPDAIRLRAINLMLEPCFNTQNTRLGRLELLRECSAAVDKSLSTTFAPSFWMSIASLLQLSLQQTTSDSSEPEMRPLGKEYEMVVDVLELGSSCFLIEPRGHEVLSVFIETVRKEAGESAIILAVIEKVSDRTAAYEKLDTDKVDTTVKFLVALATSIKDCATSHLAVYLRKTQEVIRMWVQDADRKMQSSAQSLKALHGEVVGLWMEVTKAIERLPRKDGQILLHLEPLITAGFVSRRRDIVNISIATWNKTFGKEESLRYPSQLEQALRRLRNTVELSLPSLPALEGDSVDGLSFYESDSSTEEARPAYKSPRIRGSPFKIIKSARKSTTRSPALSTPGSRRTSARQTPKVRLRHDNSQIQFEPIVSSPSNPFNQESQVLTERQKEMIERQNLSGGLFADMGAPSPQLDAAPSPMELHSDAMTADDLPMSNARTTPSKALAAMGPMDAFLGSSPTPHARKNTRKITSDDTSLATPTAVRTVKLANKDDLGSSPPRFEKESAVNAEQANSDILVGSSFDYRQPETPYDTSFDEGTTIDEDALLDAVAKHSQNEDPSEVEPFSDVVMSDVPSSTIDVQLTAQLDADIKAQTGTGTDATGKPAPESNNEFVDATSQPQSSMVHIDQVGSDTEVDESEPPQSMVKKTSRVSRMDTRSTSRVGDSFDSTPRSKRGTPQSQSVRRSFRQSGTPSPLLSLGAQKQRKLTPAKSVARSKKTTMEEPQEEPNSTEPVANEQPDSDGMLDNIVVDMSPKKGLSRGRKRKSTSDAEVVVPETHRKRGPVRRSQSLLSQVENSQDVFVEDTPAPKRARQSASQDVSETKNSQAQTKRLSHVQVTPKRSSESGRSSSLAGSTPAREAASTPAVAPTPAICEPSASQQAGVAATPSRSFTERVILTPRSIINQLKSLKDYLFSAPQLVIGREEEREIDDALFDIRRSVLKAGLRGEKDGEQK
ncbi:hypothetical protein SNOG_06635 [Parastagonospora nodorum SN15]|uniref:Telomere-associated protein Rif1 N-terminal domain-containing protein n=1 Tax=Phaeosphaeria nodorum (strain SN15 / ATCC MYA-4574 / FGSC 10173) TaxID=321614 RepID=Q0UNM9_PHANO|nr:hypothetical protein SNOG_06635 [Parastagonospora nodorum SN15]EAT86466.2 hypothetical protein SNOG_06635 [Parastagonospora nodorum SN15]